MRRIIIILFLLALVLAPLETLGVLRRGTEKTREVAGSSETQTFVEKLKTELPKLGEKVSGLLSRLFPKLNIGVKEVE
ncbi:hypothetical protein GTO10_05710 [Candidatus Saccharibacteria bacterium]|nr:hypothetical protein [Candidatus Saccharibacteria bacterium]